MSDRLKEGLRQWSVAMTRGELESRVSTIQRSSNEYGIDPFGFDLNFAVAAIAPFLWLYKHYFRVETFGIEKVPKGRVLLIANHSGGIPIDGAMIALALFTEANPPRAIRAMVEKWVPTLPYVSTFFARVGQIVGTPENCRRLLANEEAILVFPEGVRGVSKLWNKRYQLQEFGLGFMRLALETHTPIVPIAVIGAEEQAPAFFELKPLARMLGIPVLPVTATGLPIPLPTKYRIYFGDPLTFTGRADDEDAELEKRVKVVKDAIAAMIDKGLREREHIFW